MRLLANSETFRTLEALNDVQTSPGEHGPWRGKDSLRNWRAPSYRWLKGKEARIATVIPALWARGPAATWCHMSAGMRRRGRVQL
jgi:hypothetical protein